MRWIALALLLVAVSAAGQVQGNIRGKVARMSPYPAVRLAAVGGVACADPVDFSACRFAWAFDGAETVQDANQPCCVQVVVTPTPSDAAGMIYRLHVLSSPTLILGARVISGVACDLTGCQTPPIGSFIPELAQGGMWSIALTRERLPQFHESTESTPIAFRTLNSGGPPPPPPPPPGNVTFVGTDSATKGTWTGTFGANGSAIATIAGGLPVTTTGQTFIWSAPTTDLRALATSTARIASAWFDNKTFTLTVTPLDAIGHRISLYLLDWDQKTRIEKIEVLQAGVVQDTRTAAAFTGGVYYTWIATGQVQFRITNLEEAPVVVSGVFLDPVVAGPPPPPPVTCPYVTPAGVLTPLAIGDVKEGINIFPSISRNDQLLSMGMELDLYKLSPTQVQMKATCKGPLPQVAPLAAPRAAPPAAPRAAPVRPKDEV